MADRYVELLEVSMALHGAKGYISVDAAKPAGAGARHITAQIDKACEHVRRWQTEEILKPTPRGRKKTGNRKA